MSAKPGSGRRRIDKVDQQMLGRRLRETLAKLDAAEANARKRGEDLAATTAPGFREVVVNTTMVSWLGYAISDARREIRDALDYYFSDEDK